MKLTVSCDDRFGMLKQITAVISDTKTNIRNIEARTGNGQANVDIVLDIADLKHLEELSPAFEKFPACTTCSDCRRYNVFGCRFDAARFINLSSRAKPRDLLVFPGGKMREVIATKDGPKAIGPYSQAIKANGFVFVSGQVAIDPATQQVISGDVAAQTDRVLQNLSAF